MNTIKLPVRFGRFLGRKLDPRRRESLEDSLRIRSSRLEERQERLAQRVAEHETSAGAEPSSPQELAHDAEQRKGRGRIVDWATGIGDVLDLGYFVIRPMIVVLRLLLKAIGGVLEGLSAFDI